MKKYQLKYKLKTLNITINIKQNHRDKHTKPFVKISTLVPIVPNRHKPYI